MQWQYDKNIHPINKGAGSVTIKAGELAAGSYYLYFDN
jgi:hypothetical protein